MDFKLNLKNALRQLDFYITDEVANQFLVYKNLLLLWNESVNLTSITDVNEIIVKHFSDSLTLAKVIDVKNKSIADIGTGAGFPGLPIKICFPSTEVLLVDSLNKRINFLDEVIFHLKLTEIKTLHSRAEDVGKTDLRETFDICTCRAVSQLNIVLEYTMPLVKVGGCAAILKGNNIAEEISEATSAIETLGGKLSDIKTVKLPNSEISHKIVIVEKLRQTPSLYPRSPKKISRQPII